VFLGEIDSFFNLLERLKSWGSGNRKHPEFLADRFIFLFEDHGVHRNQIPKFLGDLEVPDLATSKTLLSALNDPILDKASSIFGVRREWIDGASDQIYKHLRFYKQPEKFQSFIKELHARSDFVGGELVVGKGKKNDPRNYDAVFMIQEEMAWVGEKQIFRYHFCD